MFNREKSLITQGWVKIRKKGWGSTTDHNDQNIMYINELVSPVYDERNWVTSTPTLMPSGMSDSHEHELK